MRVTQESPKMRNQERNLEWVTMLELEDHVTEELRVESWIEGIID